MRSEPELKIRLLSVQLTGGMRKSFGYLTRGLESKYRLNLVPGIGVEIDTRMDVETGLADEGAGPDYQ
ncbi:hypothetical protein GCM10007418_03250 [Halopseudomonas salina]|uniref:Uncharacterized protein n=1 Tax=Halopseudomonas salina TaxID=1323744 RepID=A0ABQ1NXK7_9GAMM|nr:hypothetical protein GCM10007418_03250 [Halopseudomonas salina]